MSSRKKNGLLRNEKHLLMAGAELTIKGRPLFDTRYAAYTIDGFRLDDRETSDQAVLKSAPKLIELGLINTHIIDSDLRKKYWSVTPQGLSVGCMVYLMQVSEASENHTERKDNLQASLVGQYILDSYRDILDIYLDSVIEL